MRERLRLEWPKELPDTLYNLFESKGTAPKEWEDGPDGALVGLVIIVSAWIANQAAEKTRDEPNNDARRLFEEYLRPVIMAAMEQGVKMADERKR